jgi:hypothetical protein
MATEAVAFTAVLGLAAVLSVFALIVGNVAVIPIGSTIVALLLYIMED